MLGAVLLHTQQSVADTQVPSQKAHRMMRLSHFLKVSPIYYFLYKKRAGCFAAAGPKLMNEAELASARRTAAAEAATAAGETPTAAAASRVRPPRA